MCPYFSDCQYCMNFEPDAGICRLSGDFVIDTDSRTQCPDFKCGVPFEYCCGDCSYDRG